MMCSWADEAEKAEKIICESIHLTILFGQVKISKHPGYWPVGKDFPRNPVSSTGKETRMPNQKSHSWCSHSLDFCQLSDKCNSLDRSWTHCGQHYQLCHHNHHHSHLKIQLREKNVPLIQGWGTQSCEDYYPAMLYDLPGQQLLAPGECNGCSLQ